MKNIQKYLIWFIIWLSFITWLAFAANNWVLWNLFEKINWSWVLKWENIKNLSITWAKIADWTIWWNKLTNTLSWIISDNTIWVYTNSWRINNNTDAILGIKIPEKLSELTNDEGFITSMPSWFNTLSIHNLWISTLNWLPVEPKVKKDATWWTTILNKWSGNWQWNKQYYLWSYKIPDNKWIYQIRIGGYVDDCWMCMAYVNWKAAFWTTHCAYFTELWVDWSWAWNARNKSDGSFSWWDFTIDQLSGQKKLWWNDKRYNYSAYNIAPGVTFLKWWDYVSVHWRHNWGASIEYVNCTVEAKLWTLYY